METSEIISLPGFSAGGFSATTSNSLWGAEVDLRKNIWLDCRGRVDMIAGFRYLHFDEDLRLAESFMGLPGSRLNGFSGIIMDSFATRNDFYGGQIGLSGELQRGRWSLNTQVKVALGGTHQAVDINGVQLAATPSGMIMAPAGLLAQPTNIGESTRDKFTVVPEVGFNVGYQVTDHMKLFVGYSFLYWSNVLRAGDQVDRVLNVNENAFPLLQRPGAPLRPMVPFKDTDLWAQGINFGMQFTW
jgi:hypothetical protein